MSVNLATTDLDGTFARLQAGDAEVVQVMTSRMGSATAPSATLRATSSTSRYNQWLKKPVKTSTTKSATKSPGFSAAEKAAMRERQGAEGGSTQGGRGEGPARRSRRCRSRIASMAERIHAIVKANAPALSPKTWYGMPAYADKDGKVVIYFQARQVRLEVRDVRLHRHGEPRRRRHVADLLRAEEADRRRREEDCRAREESGELRTRAAKRCAGPPAARSRLHPCPSRRRSPGSAT